MLKIARFLINLKEWIDLDVIFNILCYFRDIIQSEYFDPLRVEPGENSPSPRKGQLRFRLI